MSNNKKLYVIVQAGGRGSRLRHHTWNKPKCLVSVNGKPILYHLFDRFTDAKFIVIGDYLYDQLEKYLEINSPKVDYTLIRAVGKGTASGILDALKMVPENESLILTWSDLIINGDPILPEYEKPLVFTTDAFLCRWSVSEEGFLHEKPSYQNGIPGLFYFSKASYLRKPPVSGEFVKWFAAEFNDFETLNISTIDELGDFSSIEEINDRSGFCRFFNNVRIEEDIVVKTVVDKNFNDLHAKEVAWYNDVENLGFRRIPKVYSTQPLIMERIKGLHAYQMHDLNPREQRAVIADYLDSLINLHDLASAPCDNGDIEDVYLKKTIARVQSVAAVIPGFEKDSITINGKKCRNFFSKKHQGIFEKILLNLQNTSFTAIHGDPTFSNTIIDDKLRVWFIDPRGYFSKSGIMGDPWYDFAKVYYSAVGGYDAFNRRKFKLHIDSETVEILMEDPIFSKTANDIFEDYFGVDFVRIKILHGLIWLALSGYARDDLDSIVGSFYMGLYRLEEGIQKF